MEISKIGRHRLYKAYNEHISVLNKVKYFFLQSKIQKDF